MSIISWYDRYLVRLELERLYAAMVMVQQHAVGTHKSQAIIVDCAHNCYITPYGREQLTPGVIFGVVDNIKGPPSSPLTTIKKPVTFSNNRIVFYEQGIIDAGTIYMTDKAKNYQYALSCGVGEEPYIRCYYYQKCWTLLR